MGWRREEHVLGKMDDVAVDVDLVVPLKPPRAGKSRLRGGLGYPSGDGDHEALVLALAADTLAAATGSRRVRRVLVVASDPAAVVGLRELGVEIVAENGPRGLNAALRQGARELRRDDPHAVIGALQADLPSLLPDDLDAAIAEADGRRAFTADRQGTGTTLLLSSAGGGLEPRFGEGSASAHVASGAVALDVTAPSLRSDVDTADDLVLARNLGLGPRTAAVVGELCLLG
ncbi:2-phospho-L-lactate guanylyltransferase [Amycolatopsis minnesotensis]|uniref:Phosphoenolpyruvate guanylyltransferase n=1 Tax=Amycolatopsis minnesotensis TaxID=337894 RepID=A0ABN2RDK6_9PSEU